MPISRCVWLLITLLAITRCTGGSLPTEGKLPPLDGSSLNNVNATLVAGTSGASIAAAVNGASDASTSSAIVKRDAAGNFSAGTITAILNGSALFAQGKQGTNLASASTLSLGSDGSYFYVTGNTPIAAISPAPAGAIARLQFTAPLNLIHSTALRLSGKGSFTVAADDVFEFVSLGGGIWQEIARSTSVESRIFYQVSTPISFHIDGSPALLAYDGKKFDTQGEWNPATATFTPKQSGLYGFSLSLVTAGGSWATNQGCTANVGLAPAPNTFTNFTYMQASTGVACIVALSATAFLNVGDSLAMNAGANPSGPGTTILTGAANGCYVQIWRIQR